MPRDGSVLPGGRRWHPPGWVHAAWRSQVASPGMGSCCLEVGGGIPRDGPMLPWRSEVASSGMGPCCLEVAGGIPRDGFMLPGGRRWHPPGWAHAAWRSEVASPWPSSNRGPVVGGQPSACLSIHAITLGQVETPACLARRQRWRRSASSGQVQRGVASPHLALDRARPQARGSPACKPEHVAAANKRMELSTANRDLAVAIDRGRSSSVERCPASKSERALLSTL